MTEETVDHRENLRKAFTMRARAYAHMFDVLREEFGEERAMNLGKETTRRLGVQMGEAFKDLDPSDMSALRDRFLGGIPDRDEMFAPDVERCDDEQLTIYFHACPLKRAWMEMGRSDRDIELLCEMAGAIDQGLFTTAGFTFDSTTWKSGEPGCCRLKLRPGPARGEG